METKQSKAQRAHMADWIRDVHYIWWQEIKAVFRDQGVVIFFLVVPLIYPILYAFIYMQEVVHESTMVVVDHDKTPLSRQYLRMIDATPGVDIQKDCHHLSEANDCLRRKEAYAILVVPRGFADDVSTGRQSTVSLYSDLSSILYYKNFMLAANDAALALGRQYQLKYNSSGTAYEANVSVQPITNRDIAYFNPSGGYSSFLVSPILILIIQQTMLLGVCMLAGTNRERNALHALIPIALKHYKGALRIVTGKSLAYLSIYIPVSIYVLVLVPFFFGLPQLASAAALLLFTLPYLLACTFFALTISCITRSRESAIMILVFSSVIFIFLTGITWPTSAIPSFWRIISQLFPSTPGAQGFVALNTMGAHLYDVLPQYQTLWIQTVAYALLAAVGYMTQMKVAQKALSKHLSSHNKPVPAHTPEQTLPN